jgi:hypothetical protein
MIAARKKSDVATGNVPYFGKGCIRAHKPASKPGSRCVNERNEQRRIPLGQSLFGDIGSDEAERVEGGGTCCIVKIGVVFVLVGIVAHTLDNEPGDQRMAAHDKAKGCALHVDRGRSTYKSLHILKRMLCPHSRGRGHRPDVTGYLALLWRKRRAFQAPDKRLPVIE